MVKRAETPDDKGVRRKLIPGADEAVNLAYMEEKPYIIKRGGGFVGKSGYYHDLWKMTRKGQQYAGGEVVKNPLWSPQEKVVEPPKDPAQTIDRNGKYIIMYKKVGDVRAVLLKPEKGFPESGFQRATWGTTEPDEAKLFATEEEALDFAKPILGDRDALEYYKAMKWEDLHSSWFYTPGGDGYRPKGRS